MMMKTVIITARRAAVLMLTIGLLCSIARADLSSATFPTTLPESIVATPALEPLPPSYFMYDYVDIGDELGANTEAAHNLIGWGRIEGFPSHGGRGGFGKEPDCRVIWEADSGEEGRSATIDLDFGGQPGNKYIALRWLEGQTDDSFDFSFWIAGVLQEFKLEDAESSPTEVWYDLGVWKVGEVTGVHTVTLEATAEAWGGQPTWGQVAFSEMGIYAIPAPGAALLGAIGLGLAVWVKRRSS